MKKGFNPTPKPERRIKNVSQALQRKTREFKNILRNPLVVASQLERSANLKLDTSGGEE